MFVIVCKLGCKLLEVVVKNMLFLVGGDIIWIRVFKFGFLLIVIINKLVGMVLILIVVLIVVMGFDRFFVVIRMIV